LKEKISVLSWERLHTVFSSSEYTASQVSGEMLRQVAGTNQSFVVQGLSPSTTYYFAIKTADEALNWSGISNSPNGTTSAASGGGNEIETFGYDFLDRLTSVSGAYSETYTYNQIGNMMSKNGVVYTYGDSAHKHAVTLVGSTSYDYDANGNMTSRGSQTITWDVENRVTSITGGALFIYDGDGRRVKKTENGETILYANKYYERNLTTGVVTTSYYLADKLVAQREGTTLNYIHQDHLTGTSVISNSTGSFVSSISYFPFGTTRAGSVPTDKKFTGQRLDNTDLYYYGARYYDPTIGRFISPDTIVPNPVNPQSLNRYTYCLNNPLKYVDPSGHQEGKPVNPYTIDPILLTGISREGWQRLVDEYDAWLVSLRPTETEKPQPSFPNPKISSSMPYFDVKPWDYVITIGVSTITKYFGLAGCFLMLLSLEGDTNPAITHQPTYPGDDPTVAPEGYGWKGKPGTLPGDPEGSYYNPDTHEVLRPNLDHPAPKGPHWDWKDPWGNWWRLKPDGTIEPH
jgi:RHS repeat-associated protein